MITGKKRRGFASMSADKQRAIASKGGRAAHEKGVAHQWTQEEARVVGRKGGQVSRGGRGKLPENEAHTAGRKGGQASAKKQMLRRNLDNNEPPPDKAA